jgi:ABC-type uncharacterized transport system ATPase subunit
MWRIDHDRRNVERKNIHDRARTIRYLIVNTDHDFDGLGQIGYELVTVDQGKAYFKRLLTGTKEYKQLAENIAKEILDTPIDILGTTSEGS